MKKMHAKLDMVFGSKTHRVRLTIYWKKQLQKHQLFHTRSFNVIIHFKKHKRNNETPDNTFNLIIPSSLPERK